MIICTSVAQLIKELSKFPADATLSTSYSDEVWSGTVVLGHDANNNIVQIVGSEEDV